MSNDFSKYIFTSNFKDFKQLNKYFKMFDTLKELEDDLIGLNKSKKIEIIKIDESTIDICINVLTLDNNKVIVTLKKVEISDKEKINKILKENEEIKKEIKELKEKNLKIIDLEKEIKDLKNEVINLKNKLEKSNNINNSINNIYDFASDVFYNVEEKKLVLNEISKYITSVKLLFNSKIHGADINKLISAYLNKPNLLFSIRTKKGKRFGAYSTETFENKIFNKQDINAFLFSLDKKIIMKSKLTKYGIWKQSLDSIDFGDGSDLRIFHDFSSDKNYTYQGSGYNYLNCPNFALNGEKNFSVDILEIFQIYFK